MGNKGAFITLTKDLKPEFTVYEAVVSLASNLYVQVIINSYMHMKCYTVYRVRMQGSLIACELRVFQKQFAIVRNTIIYVSFYSIILNQIYSNIRILIEGLLAVYVHAALKVCANR